MHEKRLIAERHIVIAEMARPFLPHQYAKFTLGTPTCRTVLNLAMVASSPRGRPVARGADRRG